MMRVTVTLDGRILVEQGRNTIELVDPTVTAELRALLDEAAVQLQVWPAAVAQYEEAAP